MTKNEKKYKLKIYATDIINQSKFYGESYYLRKLLNQNHDFSISSSSLRSLMQELADEGYFERSKSANGSQGYTWMIKKEPAG